MYFFWVFPYLIIINCYHHIIIVAVVVIFVVVVVIFVVVVVVVLNNNSNINHNFSHQFKNVHNLSVSFYLFVHLSQNVNMYFKHSISLSSYLSTIPYLSLCRSYRGVRICGLHPDTDCRTDDLCLWDLGTVTE